MEKEESLNFLHPCSEAPKNSADFKEKDANCLENIEFFFSTRDGGIRLGEGNNATVFKLVQRRNIENAVAVKIVFFETYGNSEVGIACELNSLMNLTPVVMRTYGYLVCDREDLHPVWVESVPAPFNVDNTYMLLFMNIAPYRWKYDSEKNNPFPITRKDDALALLYTMAHGLYILRRDLGFVHGDLHDGNVMLTVNAHQDGPVRLFFSDTIYSDVTLPYNIMPKFIDYGTSYTANYPREKDVPQRPFTDTEMLLNLFDAETRYGRPDVSRVVDIRALYNQKMSKGLQRLFEKEYSTKILLIFMHKVGIFDSVSTIQSGTLDRPLKRTKMCIQCGINEGSHFIQGKEGILCGEYCNHDVGDMAYFLPKEK